MTDTREIRLNSPTIAEMEESLVVAMNVRTWVLDFPRVDYLSAREALGD